MKKTLRPGDFFGEISLLFGCRRSATVKSRSYCGCSFLTNKDFRQLIANHGFFKKYLIMNIMKSYHDELRVFLVTCLKEIDYLKDTKEDVLTHLAINMIAQQADKDSLLFNAEDSFKSSESTAITIIYSGKLAITAQIDANTEMIIDYISKGAIISAHNCLSYRQTTVTVKCLTSVTYYYLPIEVLQKVSFVYPNLMNTLNIAQKQAKFNQMLNLYPLDYQEINFQVEEKYVLPNNVRLTEAEKKKIPEL